MNAVTYCEAWNEWRWFGTAGHLIVGRWCRFHLCTQVGPWLVSTVGEYVHPRHSEGSERAEAKYLERHPNGEEIGYGRTYETMVFRAGEPCVDPECNCGMPSPTDWNELDSIGYNNRGDATRGHLALCERWAAKNEKGDNSQSVKESVMKPQWTRDGYQRYRHIPTGVIVESTSNPDALRMWYVDPLCGNQRIANEAARSGCGGGFFHLRAAKRAVEQAASHT